MTCKVAIDTCVVIDIMEGKRSFHYLRAGLKGKPIVIVLCDVVLREVKRVRNLSKGCVVSRLRDVLGRKVQVIALTRIQKEAAKGITKQYQTCHHGDNEILSFCRENDCVLVTRDRGLLRASDWSGVPAFHPSRAGGI